MEHDNKKTKVAVVLNARNEEKTITKALECVTMIYTHVLNRGGLGVKSPADLLG